MGGHLRVPPLFVEGDEVGGGEAHTRLGPFVVGAVEEVGEFYQRVTGLQLADQDPRHQDRDLLSASQSSSAVSPHEAPGRHLVAAGADHDEIAAFPHLARHHL